MLVDFPWKVHGFPGIVHEEFIDIYGLVMGSHSYLNILVEKCLNAFMNNSWISMDSFSNYSIGLSMSMVYSQLF